MNFANSRPSPLFPLPLKILTIKGGHFIKWCYYFIWDLLPVKFSSGSWCRFVTYLNSISLALFWKSFNPRLLRPVNLEFQFCKCSVKNILSFSTTSKLNFLSKTCGWEGRYWLWKRKTKVFHIKGPFSHDGCRQKFVLFM